MSKDVTLTPEELEELLRFFYFRGWIEDHDLPVTDKKLEEIDAKFQELLYELKIKTK